MSTKRWCYLVWLIVIAGFAVLHGINLRADFPNHSPWLSDWAKYTDEGWYGNAAIRAHLFGRWYLPGDNNPAPAIPALPFVEWVLFFFTGVTVEAARGLAVSFFFANLVLSYLLLRTRGPRWMGLLAVTLLVTSPFMYCFSRLAILEPLQITLTLAALNLAVRLPRVRRPVLTSIGIGLLFTLMLLTKTTGIFLFPALGWAIVLPLWYRRKQALCCLVAAVGTSIAAFSLWIVLVIHAGLLPEFKYFFSENKYIRPKQFYWPLVSFWWSFHGALWVDHTLAPLAGLVVAGALIAIVIRRSAWGRKLLLDPVFGASVLAIAGFIFFMTYQDHPQPRYYAVVAVFCFFIVAQGTEALIGQIDAPHTPRGSLTRRLGWGIVTVAAMAAAINGVWVLDYAAHPEYTFIDAAERLTHYIDEHPNGNRLLVSVSGDQITLVTHLPNLSDEYGLQDLASKLAMYQPGWWATWNDIDPATLEDLHSRFSLEQVARFRAFDDPQRNVLVLFKLHPIPGGDVRDPGSENLQVPLPGDKIDIPIQ